MKNFELLAPAGNFEKLKTALYYGADAVYVGGTLFSLRALSENFNNEQMKEAVDYTHEREWRVAKDFPFQYSYVAFVILNSYTEMEQIPVDIVESIGKDKFIFIVNTFLKNMANIQKNYGGIILRQIK